MTKVELITLKEKEFHEASLQFSIPTKIEVLGLQTIEGKDYPVLKLGYGTSGEENTSFGFLKKDGTLVACIEQAIWIDVEASQLNSAQLFDINFQCAQYYGKKLKNTPIKNGLIDAFSRKVASTFANNVLR